MYEHSSPIFTRTYDFLIWLLDHTEKFPKSERFRMAKRAEDAAFDFYEDLVSAVRSRQPRNHLLHADLALDRLRLYLRLCHARGLLGVGSYEYAAGNLVEIGRLLGGWIKTLKENTI